jgi:NADPH:quinone reductase-like Zn-dependent oxidoreductase
VTSSSDEKLELVKSKFGAHYGIRYKKHPEWSKEVMRLTEGEGVDFVLENAPELSQRASTRSKWVEMCL